MSSVESLVLINDRKANFVLLRVERSHGTVLLNDALNDGVALTASADATSFLFAHNNGRLFAARAMRRNAQCHLSVAVFDLGTKSQPTKPKLVSQEFCVAAHTSNRQVPFSRSIVAKLSSNARILDVLLSTSDAAGLSIDLHHVQAHYVASSFVFDAQSVRTLRNAGVGSAPSLTLAHDSALNASVVLHVHTDSYCWNSHKLNTRSPIALCSSTPVSVPQVATYTYGRFETFIDTIAKRKAFSACDETLLHGAFGQTLLKPVKFFFSYSWFLGFYVRLLSDGSYFRLFWFACW